MSDVTGAPASAPPLAPAAASSSPAPVLESLHEAAANRFEALQQDRSHGSKILARDADAINVRKTLLEIMHGAGDETSKVALAASIGLQPRPTLAAGQRQNEATAAAEAARSPAYSYGDRSEFGSGLSNVTSEFNAWTAEIGLPPTIAKTVVQAAVNSGVRKMDAAAYATWKDRQDELLLRTAHNDPAVVQSWRDAAAKVLARGKFNFGNSAALNSAQVVRSLALFAGTMK